MRRRQLLAAVLAGSLGGVAGCTGSAGPAGDSPTPTPATPAAVRLGDLTLPVPSEEIYTALGRDQIPAIVDPRFGEDWSTLAAPAGVDDTSLGDDAAVIGVEHEGVARAYPLAILDRHEIVNDDLGGPIIVSYCVQCGSAVVAERRVAGQPTVFGVSGKLWRSDLVMYDRRTESLWSQIIATAIRGPRTGDTLRIRPSSLTSWGDWRSAHPDSAVLLPPPASNTVRGRETTFDYFEPKYGYDGESQLIGYDSDAGRLHPKTLVLGIVEGSTAVAYPFHAVRDAGGVVNDRVGGRPVVIATTPGGSLVGYDRRVNGTVRRFAADGPRHVAGAGSRWERESGRAVDGPHAGTRLPPATDVPAMFWFGWERFHPDTGVYGRAVDPTPTP